MSCHVPANMEAAQYPHGTYTQACVNGQESGMSLETATMRVISTKSIRQMWEFPCHDLNGTFNSMEYELSKQTELAVLTLGSKSPDVILLLLVLSLRDIAVGKPY